MSLMRARPQRYRLVSRLTGGTGSGEGPWLLGDEAGDGLPYGVLLDDGAYHGLAGQPPLATTKGWGRLPWR